MYCVKREQKLSYSTSILNTFLCYLKPDEWEVKLIFIVFLHGRNIKARPLKAHFFALFSNFLDYLLQLFAFEQIIGTKQADMQSFRTIEVLSMVVEDIHVLQLLRNDDFFLQKSPDQFISQCSECLRNVFRQLQVYDCDFLAFGTLVETGEVIDACDFQGVFGEDAVNFFLEVRKQGGQSLLGGFVAQDELEEGEMGYFVIMLTQDIRRAELGTGVQTFSEFLLELKDLLALLRKSERKRGEMSEEGTVFDYVFVLIRHYILLQSKIPQLLRANLYFQLYSLNSLSSQYCSNRQDLIYFLKTQYQSCLSSESVKDSRRRGLISPLLTILPSNKPPMKMLVEFNES